MTGVSQRQLVFEVERIQTVRRRVATHAAICRECDCLTDLVHLSDLAQTFEISVAEAVLQLRARRVHMQHLPTGNIAVCTESLLMRSVPEDQTLMKSLPPTSPFHVTNSSE